LQHEATGAIGIFGKSGADASLPEECGLLITGNASDGNAVKA
jgi:hypothetical protein